MRPTPLPAPNAHPLVKFLAERMDKDGIARYVAEELSGLGSSTMQAWWNGDRAIILQNIEAALGVVGYGLKPCLLPEGDASRCLFHPKGVYKTRCGIAAYIDRVTSRFIFGRAFHLSLQWRLDGRRVPVGGDDPFDLVAPVKAAA